VGKGRCRAPTYKLSFCSNPGSNGKTEPYYWLATDRTNNNDNTKKQRKTERGKNKTKGKDKTGKDYEQVGLTKKATHL